MSVISRRPHSGHVENGLSHRVSGARRYKDASSLCNEDTSENGEPEGATWEETGRSGYNNDCVKLVWKIVLVLAGLVALSHTVMYFTLNTTNKMNSGDWGSVPSDHHRDDIGSLGSGRSRVSNASPRIAIISNSVAYPYNWENTDYWSRFKEYFANKDCYARTHGYDLILDSRNHVNDLGFYVNGETGEKGGTNIHFNKPYLIRKWLPEYDWVLWLDMDTLVVDIGRRIETFIEEIGGQDGDIHVLVPQDQNSVYFFSAYALLLRNSPETRAMVDDWFELKDTCPYALYDDQSRLYAAILRMQLRCVDKAIRSLNIKRVPHLSPPVAYSRLPTRQFTKGNDTGLAFQGMFGGIKTHPHLVTHSFAVHTKPFCQKGGVQACSPYVDAILAPNFQKGMQRCYGAGWIADPFASLDIIYRNYSHGKSADREVKDLSAGVNGSMKGAMVPALNLKFGKPFDTTSMLKSDEAVAGKGSSLRIMGEKTDKTFCFASIPGGSGGSFMGQVLAPLLKDRFCAGGECSGINVAEAQYQYENTLLPCTINRVWQFFPYNLLRDYPAQSGQHAWLMSMIQDPVDRVLTSFFKLKARMEEERGAGDEAVEDRWVRTLRKGGTDTSFVQYGGNPPPVLEPDMTLEDYVDIPGVDEVMTKFFMAKEWDTTPHNSFSVGRSRPIRFRAGGWDAFDHWQANAGVGALMEYQELLSVGIPEEVAEQIQRLREDSAVRRTIEGHNKKDQQLYERALMEFKRRCRYYDIEVPDNPYRLFKSRFEE